MAFVRQIYPNVKTLEDLSFMTGPEITTYLAEVNAWNTMQDKLEQEALVTEISNTKQRFGLPYPNRKTDRQVAAMTPDQRKAYLATLDGWYDQQEKDRLKNANLQNVATQKRQLEAMKTYNSFSGADIVASIRPLGGKPIVFGSIQTISYSIYRPMTPVYSLGKINANGVVRGQRTIAGSIIFTVFDRHVLKTVMDSYRTQDNSFRMSYGLSESDIVDLRQNSKTDEMPPFDVNISFLNEYGQSATLDIYGLHIVSEGQTMSIEDMITENTMQYIAMDIDLMDYGAEANYDVEF